MGVILVVDDEPAIRHAFARAFRDSGLTLHLVSTACEALTYVTRTRPDVIVLDVHLPDATGMETFRRLRALDARIPIILITGHGTAELAIEAMKEGAFEYLLKPLELKELRAVIDRAAQSSRLMNVPAAIPDLESSNGTGRSRWSLPLARRNRWEVLTMAEEQGASEAVGGRGSGQGGRRNE